MEPDQFIRFEDYKRAIEDFDRYRKEMESKLDAIRLAAETGEGSSQLTHTKAALRRILELLK